MKKKVSLITLFVLLIVSVFLLFPLADNSSNTGDKQDVKSLYLNQFQISGDTDIYYDNQAVYEVQFAGETIWRAGSEVTYNLDVDNSQMIYHDYAESIFKGSPTPTKDGWEFIGWKLTTEPSPNDILTVYNADSTDFNVYATFRKKITVTFYNNSGSPTILEAFAYYNNGNIDNPEFNIQPVQRSGWTLQGISTETSGNNVSTVYNDITLGENTTYYSIYTKPLNLTYNAANGSNQSITRNYEILYYSTNYNTRNTKLDTAENVGFKDSYGNAVCVWQEASSGKTYDLGIAVPNEFYTSNSSNYTFNALYGSVVTYVTKYGTFSNGSNKIDKIVIYGNNIANIPENPNVSNYIVDGITWANQTNTITDFKADGKPYTVYVRLKQYHHHVTSGDIHSGDNTTQSGGLADGTQPGSNGGCFTNPIYHQHSHGSGCYTDYVHNTGNDNGRDGDHTWTIHHWYCSYCGRSWESETHCDSKRCWSIGNPDCHNSVLTCSQSTTPYYTYSRTCGMSNGQVLYTYGWQ